MEWHRLLSTRRLGRDEPYDTHGRSPFQRDHDRIVFCSAFRRMQDKTQVFPLAHLDYIRTRLTHSLEVSCVGRSLGLAVSDEIIRKYDLKKIQPADFGVIVAAACLGHDIGNPPFGHSGEAAMRHWFLETKTGQDHMADLSKGERADFLKFEGNAQAFRILTRLQHPNNEGGMQLSCSTLGALAKYPRPAYVAGNLEHQGISMKKYGYFLEDASVFEEMATESGLIKRADGCYSRHPLTFLVEAADDICYHLIDFGDGFRLGHINYEEARDLLGNLLEDEKDQALQRIENFREDKEKVEYLVGRAISRVITLVSQRFLQREEEILKGDFDDELVSNIHLAPLLKKIKVLSVAKVYGAREVIEIEAAGFEILGTLLELLVNAVEDLAKRGQKASSRSKKIIQLLPVHFQDFETKGYSKYQRLLRVTDYVSGMTDSYALKVYRTLTGIQWTGGIL